MKRPDEAGRARRRLVATVEKRVKPHRVQAAATRELGDRDRMILMAVHATGRDQSEAVQRGAAIAGTVDRVAQRRVLVEAAVLDGAVDARQRLVDEPSGADGEMAHLGVALLAGRQSHRLTAGVDRRVRPALLERVELRGARGGDRVPVRIRVASPPVEDDEHEGPHPAHPALRGCTRSGVRLGGSGDDDAELLGAQAHATDQRAVDVRLGKQRGGVGGGDAAAVEHARRHRRGTGRARAA